MGVAIAQENTVASTRTLSTGINGMCGYFVVCVQYCQYVEHNGPIKVFYLPILPAFIKGIRVFKITLLCSLKCPLKIKAFRKKDL